MSAADRRSLVSGSLPGEPESCEASFTLRQAAALLAGARRVVFFTGAGVSTESGIPDFRSPNGVWANYNPRDFTFQRFIASPETRAASWSRLLKSGLLEDLQPNPAHYAICAVAEMGTLDCVITQNVDGLHQKAGVDPAQVIEIHGTARQIRCLSCERRMPTELLVPRLQEGERDPRCEECQGILKLATVSFGQPMPEAELREAATRAATCDLFVIVGSSLVVHPAATIPLYALERGTAVIMVNREPTRMDRHFRLVLRGQAAELVPAMVALARDLPERARPG